MFPWGARFHRVRASAIDTHVSVPPKSSFCVGDTNLDFQLTSSIHHISVHLLTYFAFPLHDCVFPLYTGGTVCVPCFPIATYICLAFQVPVQICVPYPKHKFRFVSFQLTIASDTPVRHDLRLRPTFMKLIYNCVPHS